MEYTEKEKYMANSEKILNNIFYIKFERLLTFY